MINHWPARLRESDEPPAYLRFDTWVPAGRAVAGLAEGCRDPGIYIEKPGNRWEYNHVQPLVANPGILQSHRQAQPVFLLANHCSFREGFLAQFK